MPRPPARTQLPQAGFTMTENFHFDLGEFLNSLSESDKLAFLNKIRDGSLFNFTPTSQ